MSLFYTLFFNNCRQTEKNIFSNKILQPRKLPNKVKEIFCYRVKEQGLMSPRFAPITLCYLDSRLVAFLRQFLLQAPRILKLLLQQQNPLLGLNLLKIATRHWWLFDSNTSTELYLLTLFLSFLIAEYKLCKMYVKFHYLNINFSTQLFISNFLC